MATLRVRFFLFLFVCFVVVDVVVVVVIVVVVVVFFFVFFFWFVFFFFCLFFLLLQSSVSLFLAYFIYADKSKLTPPLLQHNHVIFRPRTTPFISTTWQQ